MKSRAAVVYSKQIAAINYGSSHVHTHISAQCTWKKVNENANGANTIIGSMLWCCSVIARFQALEWKRKQTLSLGFGDAIFLGWWSFCMLMVCDVDYFLCLCLVECKASKQINPQRESQSLCTAISPRWPFASVFLHPSKGAMRVSLKDSDINKTY